MARTSNTMRWAVALALLTVTVTMYTTDAAARAGSGGSRGSRSFSRPATPPASPATPSSPSRQYAAPAQPMQPQASRGMFGGLMGGLAGFALGGLLGSMLFGGMGGFGGGGFGLMDMLLVGGALYLLYRFMMARRAQQPALATAGGYGGGSTVDVPSTGGGVATAAPPVEVPSELDRGLGHIRQMDAGFDADALTATARRLFSEVQRALGARDMSAVNAELTPRMYNELTSQCERLRASGRTNHVESIDIRRAEATEAWQESGQDYVTVYVGGSLVDYTVDDTSGAVVEGNRASQDFAEYWTFVRNVGPNRWKLSAIQTA
jgi:predicted lipid-binding transport protein (Tim44 family)